MSGLSVEIHIVISTSSYKIFSHFETFQSSDYYSSGENRLPGVLTPPTAPPICLSIPRNVMQNQYNFCSYLSQCHELWEQADLYVVKKVICEGERKEIEYPGWCYIREYL